MTENRVAASVPFYTVPEAATLLEWSEDRVWMALETGQLPAIAPAYWGNPELFEYRFAPPEVVLAIRAASTDVVRWLDRGPVGPARFPANPANIRLLAEYVEALRPESQQSCIEPGNAAWNNPMKLKAIVDELGRKFPRLESAVTRGDEWVKECKVPDRRGWYYFDALEAACHSRYGGSGDSNTKSKGANLSLAGQARALIK